MRKNMVWDELGKVSGDCIIKLFWANEMNSDFILSVEEA